MHDLGRDTRPPRTQWSTLHDKKRSCQPKITSWLPILGTRPPVFATGMGTFFLVGGGGGDLLFPQPALDSLELVGRHPVPGREVACRHTLVVSSQSPGEGDD